MLFVIGGSNEDNIVTTQLLPDNSGWLVNVQDSNLNISSEADDFSFLFNEQGDIGVSLEAVSCTVVVQVEALLVQFLEASLDCRAIKIRADAHVQQFRFRNPWW